MEGPFLTEVLERQARLHATGQTTTDSPSHQLYTHRVSITKTLETDARRHSQEVDAQTRQVIRRVQSALLREQEERQKRLYQKLLTSITYDIPDGYYDNLPLKPGMSFFKALLPSQGQADITVQVRLPRSILIYDNVYEVEPKGSDSLITERFKMSDFYKRLSKPEQPSTPVAVRRTPANITDSKCTLLTSPELFEALFKAQLPPIGIFQKLLPAASGKPSITRLFYVTSTRLCKASCSYQITSSSQAIASNTFSKYIVSTDSLGLFEVFKQAGLALKRTVGNGARLVAFLEARLGIKFEEIVLDWVEIGEKCWLLGCKGFQLDLQMLSARELRLQAELIDPETAAMQRKATIEERLAPMHCKLCLLPVKTSEMEHVLPVKLLLLYKHHLARRGKSVMDLSHLRVNTVDYLSHWVRLCDICHMLVLAEYDLFQTELRIGSLLNVPVRPPEIMGNPVYKYPNFMPGNVLQWRVLLHLQSIEWTDAPFPPLHLYFALLGQVFTYKNVIKPDFTRPMVLNCARLFTYFAPRDRSSLDYMRSIQLIFRFTRKPSWNHPFLTGNCRPLSIFSDPIAQGTDILGKITLPIYNENEIVGIITMAVGHACDQQVNMRSLLTNIERMGSIYLPDPSYMAGQELPISWLEALGGYRGAEKTVILDENEELDRQYKPLLSDRQLQSPITSSTKVMHLGVELDSHQGNGRHKSPINSVKSVRYFSLPKVDTKLIPKGRHSRRPSNYSSTAASSRVLYSVDRHTHLKTPTFLPSRHMTAPQSPADSSISPEGTSETSSSMEVLEGLLPDNVGEMWEPELVDTVDGYIKQRHLEGPRVLINTNKKTKRRGKSYTHLPLSARKLAHVYSKN